MDLDAVAPGPIPARPAERARVYCYRCGHLWVPKTDADPRRCPRCHSVKWNVPERRSRVCAFCGAEFQTGAFDDPCPSCGRTQGGDRTDRLLHCNQCDYDWHRRSDAMPKTCPMCRSKEWNEPKAERRMCQQCGHVWRSTVERPKRCPNCRSKVWDRPLRAVRCQRCGHVWRMRARGSEGSPVPCPGCGSRHWDTPMSVVLDDSGGGPRYIRAADTSSRLIVCAGCGRRWYAKGGDAVCPECGRRASFHDRIASTSMVLWRDGGTELTYVTENGYGCVYLWDGEVPVACRYVHEVLARLGTTIGDLVRDVNDGSCGHDWAALAAEMRAGESDYERNMGYFEKRLGLSPADARILAIHFTGMSPEAIARKLSFDESEVFAAFDRIMAAYSDTGIIVDDTIYTSNPFAYYRRPFEFRRGCPADVDLVMPVSDSGRAHATGCLAATGIPSGEGFMKDRFAGRTSIMPDRKRRERAVPMRMNPVRSTVVGRRIMVVDGSIARGAVLKKTASALRADGADRGRRPERGGRSGNGPSSERCRLAVIRSFHPALLKCCLYWMDMSVLVVRSLSMMSTMECATRPTLGSFKS